MPSNFQVGDELYFSGFERRGSYDVTVTKVGRKWIHLSNGYRIDRETMYADGGRYISPGRCWPNKEACDAHAALVSLWGAFRKKLDRHFRIPEGMTEERIRQAAAALGINIEEPAQ